MPLYLYLEPSPGVRIAIWKNLLETQENLDYIEQQLSEHDTQRLHSIKHQQKRKEFLSARAAYHYLGESPSDLQYTSKGKPFARGSFISLSHNHEYGAAMVGNDRAVGLDVERLDRKVDRVRHKFIAKEEETIAQEQGDLFIWVAKEAAYKLYGRKELDFREQLLVRRKSFQGLEVQIQTDEGTWLGDLFHIRGEHSLLCWCVANDSTIE